MKFKRSMFIGSSSEGLEIAEAVKSKMESYLNVTIWNEKNVFGLNQSTLDSLLRTVSMYDFALLILTPDDIVEFRHEKVIAPRDNVIFELGLFFGRLGPRHAFILCEEDTKILSDFKGITITKFRRDSTKGDLNTAVTAACDEILTAITENQNYSEIGFLPSTALAIGYFENFLFKIHTALLRKEYKIVINKKQIDINPDSFIFTIVIPNSLDFFKQKNIEGKVAEKNLHQICVKTPTRHFPFYVKGDIDSNNNILEIYDLPTTLLSSRKAIDLILYKPYIGLSPDHKHLEKREIQNFQMTLEWLIQENLPSFYNKTIRFEKPSCLDRKT